ncbi:MULTISPECIES: hypothetical protein [Rhodococcus]|uniref:Uncharacterized protein n=1 Tax=Rhodococcus erythropolis (strain PR4 / NBRC 100887) TaxID=234621 RepID=C0ZVG8_RHOE4|nr:MULTISPECIES: hypothetical protein [Rhodococcus]MBW0287344.1 hypothetical protein [Rhodococcus sp. FH8]MCW0194714.1 hypothetical protein [Rhodococcus sp. (in: high G+C Gram-positive bacteria)]QSE41195.1 hypothetical protein JXX30_28560 [Rhodococcus erythropolis]BAH36662.1 hypothetical protein RER_59540 [Rhodococcus erythropolis PR4]
MTTAEGSWLVDPAQYAPDESGEPTFPYPNKLVSINESSEEGAAERDRIHATCDPIVYTQYREEAVENVLDWFLRTGPAHALELHHQPAAAQALRDLPEIWHWVVLDKPTLLRKYVGPLKAALEVMNATMHARQDAHDLDAHTAARAAAKLLPLQPRTGPGRPTPFVQDIGWGVRNMLTPLGSKAGVWAMQVIWRGIEAARLADDLTPEAYSDAIEADLRRAFFDHVEAAIWVPKITSEDNEHSTSGGDPE